MRGSVVFSAQVGRGIRNGRRAEVAPATAGGRLQQSGRGIDRVGVAGDVQHGQVVDGVAEDGIGLVDANALEGGHFTFVGGNLDEVAGDLAINDGNFSGENPVLGDAEAADALGDDPTIGGADGPEFDANVAESGYQGLHFLKDALVHEFADILRGSGAEFLIAQAGVDLYHLPADGSFADTAGAIGAMARIDPVAGGAGDESLLKRPGHKAVSGVATPKCSITIENGNFRFAVEDLLLELR